MATRNGSATWDGDLQTGKGSVTVGNGIFEGNFSFGTRFEDGEEGTNPEELVAAAHAGCFTMALSAILGNDGHTPEHLETKARAQLRNIDGKPTITGMQLETEGRVPGIDQQQFEGYADQAKADCVISRALAGVEEMTLKATLAS
jgi:osmotically inducible protein OsmC